MPSKILKLQVSPTASTKRFMTATRCERIESVESRLRPIRRNFALGWKRRPFGSRSTKPCATSVFNSRKAVGLAKPILEEIFSSVRGNSELAMTSKISKTFSAMLDLLPSRTVTEARLPAVFVETALNLCIVFVYLVYSGFLGIYP